MKFISSVSNKDCLFQDLKMLLAHINKDKEYLFLPNPHLDKAFTFLEVVEIARSFDVNLVGFQCADKNEIFKIGKLPFIVTINSVDKHAVIVEKICRKKVKIIDPSIGVMYLSKEKFLSIIDGYGLYISSYKRKKCDKKSIVTLSKSEILISSLLEVISGTSCLIGTYFVSSSFPFYLPIIFFALFFIFEIVLRRYNVKVMEKTDDKYLYSDYYITNYYDYYNKFNIFKSSSLLFAMNLIFSTLISFFICFILIMNNLVNLISIGVVIVLSLVNFMMDKMYFTPKNQRIAAWENDIKSVNNKSDFVSLTKKINKESYQYGFAYKAKRYVTIGIYLFTSILVMGLSNSKAIDISYLIFNVVIMILLDQYFTEMLSSDTQYEKYLDSKSYLSQFFHR